MAKEHLGSLQPTRGHGNYLPARDSGPGVLPGMDPGSGTGQSRGRPQGLGEGRIDPHPEPRTTAVPYGWECRDFRQL